MNLMNPWLLMGAAGVALPIIAHMLNNFRYKDTEWAAMQFLDRSVRIRSNEIRLRDVILMLIRCLAVLLLILAFTKPSFDKNGSLAFLPGEHRGTSIIALDASFSMGHSDGAATRFERAKQKINEITEHISEGDPISLILLGDEHRVVYRNKPFNREAFSKMLSEQKIRHESINIDTIPKRLRELYEESDAQQKEVYIVSDFQEKDWSNSSTWLRNAFKELGADTKTFLVPIEGKQDNLAITRFELVSGVLRKGTSARYRASVHNFNDAPAQNIKITCKVDHVTVDVKLIQAIPAHSTETVSLFVPFNNAGSLKITAELDKDALEVDNQKRIVTNIRNKVKVLSVEGSADNSGASTSFLSKALQASGSDSDKQDLLIKSIAWVSLPTIDLDQYDVVIISDVPSVTEELVLKLNTYVRKGNGLIWFAGVNSKLPIWNKQSAKCNPPLLPAQILEIEELSSAQGGGIALDTVLSDHAVCRPLKSLPEDLLSETRYRKILKVKEHSGATKVLTLAGSKTPVLLEQSLGRGHVFMFTSSAAPSWNNMALTPAFPMLIQQAITYMTGREFEKPKTVGDSLSLIYNERPDVNDAVFTSPSGEVSRVPVSEYRNQYIALLEQSLESGFYTAQVSLQAAAKPIAVNVDTAESSVSTLTTAECQIIFADAGVILMDKSTDIASVINDTRLGHSLWRFLLITGFILLVLESLLAHRMRNKTSPQMTMEAA